jgi:predicted transcriptional regulator
MFTIAVIDMGRCEIQVLEFIKTSKAAPDRALIAESIRYSERNVQRSLSKLRKQGLVRGVRETNGRKIVYEPIP